MGKNISNASIASYKPVTWRLQKWLRNNARETRDYAFVNHLDSESIQTTSTSYVTLFTVRQIVPSGFIGAAGCQLTYKVTLNKSGGVGTFRLSDGTTDGPEALTVAEELTITLPAGSDENSVYDVAFKAKISDPAESAQIIWSKGAGCRMVRLD